MAAEEPNTINLITVKADPSTQGDEVTNEINVQFYAALMALTSKGALDIVIGAEKRSWTWERGDDSAAATTSGTAGRSRCLLYEILSPSKSTVENL